jgi:hypothetical protein
VSIKSCLKISRCADKVTPRCEAEHGEEVTFKLSQDLEEITSFVANLKNLEGVDRGR